MTSAAPLQTDNAPFARLDWGLLLGTAGIWGASFLFIAIGLEAFDPGLVTFLRVGFGAATLAVLPAARRSVPREELPRLALLGFTWMAFPLTLFPIAQQWIDSSTAGMLNSAMPLMTAVIAWLGFRIATGPRRLLGIGVGIGGILLIGIPEATSAGTNAAGVLLVVGAVTSYGVAVNIAGPLQQRLGSLPVTGRALGFATIMTAPYGLWSVPGSSFEWGPLIACFVLGAGGTGIAFAMAATLTGRIGPVRTSVVTYVIPAVSIALGVIFRDETVTAYAIAGTAVVLVGAWISSRADGAKSDRRGPSQIRVSGRS